MDKESCSPDSDRRDKTGLLEAARSLDPSGLFAYWPRGDTGTSAATNALFGAYGAANPLSSGRGSYNLVNNNSTVPGSASYGNTLSVAASQAASLGINPASAAWWTMASHLAAQDYLARLHGMTFAGLPGVEALYPNFPASHTGHSTSLSNKPSSKLNSSNSSSSFSGSSSKTSHSSSPHTEREKDKEKENWTSSEKDRDRDRDREHREHRELRDHREHREHRELRDHREHREHRELRDHREHREHRERERDKDRVRERDRERERDKIRERDKERDRDRDLNSNRSPMTAHSNSKVDHLSSLASSATSISAVPPQAHSGSSTDSSGILGGVRLPPDTEIIKYTSSIVGPKIPGTTNRGRKKTISLDPPSVSVMPTHSSTGIPIDLGQPFRSQSKSDNDSRDGSTDHVEVIKLPAHSASNGIPASSEASDEAPLNLCTKSRGSEELNIEKERISRRKPVPKQRRPISTESNPITSLSAMSQLFASELSNPTPSTAEDDAETLMKDGRPRNLGRGVSKPKKNTVASLLAQSRALGWKGSLPGDIASQLAALKGPLPTDITSQLAFFQNLQSLVEDPEAAEKRSSTPDNLGILEDKSRIRTSEDGSFTTDSTSTGGSDSESEHTGKTQKNKRDKSQEGFTVDSIKHPDKIIKMKDNKYKESKLTPTGTVDDKDQKRNSLMKEQLLYAQELNKQKELLYAVELEKERRRQHMTLVRALETRKRVEERERKRIELRAEKIARQERKLEQRRVELEILKELRRPIEDMELDDVKPFPELERIPGLKLSGQAFADTLMVFEFLHNFGETLGFDMDSLPTLNNLQGALLNDEENEEELLSIMTHLLVCAIEDPGIPNPARHITLLGQSLKQADITHTNISEILRIYLYANATGEVKALTGLNFERDREKKISEHHNLYGEEAQNQHCGKNAAFFEHLYENSTYKLSEELKEKPFLALNPTTKSAILAFLCNELLQNKAVLRQIEGSLETVILSRRERWGLDQSIRKLRGLHDRQLRYNILTKDKDCIIGLNQQAVSVNYKEKINDSVDSEVESAEESDHESECTQPEEEDQQNLNIDEINKRLEKQINKQEGCLSSLRTSNQQIRAMCLGQDRFWRRYWCLPTCRSIFVEGMESAQPDEYEGYEEIKDKSWDEERKKNRKNEDCDKEDLMGSDAEDNEDKSKCSNDGKDSKRRHRKRKRTGGNSRQGKKLKLDDGSLDNSNSDDEISDNDEVKGHSNETKISETSANETDSVNNNNDNNNINNNNSNSSSSSASNNKNNDSDFAFNKNNNSDSDNKCLVELSSNKSSAESNSDMDNLMENTGKESSSSFNGNSEVSLTRELDSEVKAITESSESEGLNKVVKKEVCGDANDKAIERKVKDKEVNCTEENIKQELKPLIDEVKNEKNAKIEPQEIKDYLRLYGEPLKSYDEHLDDLTEKELNDIKKEKESYYLGKCFEADKDLSDKRYKFEDEDPLLKAMKNELSTRIFGSPSNYIKKEEFDESHFLRSTSSPLENGEKFPGLDLLTNNYNPFRESDSECQWFSLLPKESCDPNTVILGKNDSEKMLLPLYLPTRGGLPPSPGPLPLCDSPAPLILSPEEAAMLEQFKTSGPKPPPVRKSVPQDLRRGWWRITEEDQLYKILESLHGRGVRERELKRMLTRYLDNSLETGGKSTMFKPINDLVDLNNKEEDPRVKFLVDGAPMTDEPSSWDRNVLHRVENLLLEQVENLEDKVASASMQVKGWKVPSRCNPMDIDDDEDDPKRPKYDMVEIAKERLISLEAAIERRYLKPPLGFSSAEGGIGIQADQDESIPKGLGVWREAVLKSHTAAQLSMALYMLESCIAWDKSIMKANCQFCQSGDNEDKLLLCDGCDRGYHMYCFKPKMETIPEGDWYCHECKNKANGERNCIVCGKRPVKNFVLCEHCPRAYHADCLNPPLLKIPRTKWNCANCAIKFPKKKCGRKLGWRKNKDAKPKDDSKEQKEASGNDDKGNECSDVDTDGENVPLSSAVSKDGKEKECAPLSPIPSASSLASSNSVLNDDPPPLSPQQPTTVSKKERISKKLCKELNACKILIEEMETQDEAWPFLLPVNTKQFPTYKKIIKCPMDISTIKKRLTEGIYKTKEEFVFDVRQIFNNCETFNEDDSPVGKAGHAMRSFFETRWGELMNQKPSP